MSTLYIFVKYKPFCFISFNTYLSKQKILKEPSFLQKELKNHTLSFPLRILQ